MYIKNCFRYEIQEHTGKYWGGIVNGSAVGMLSSLPKNVSLKSFYISLYKFEEILYFTFNFVFVCVETSFLKKGQSLFELKDRRTIPVYYACPILV